MNRRRESFGDRFPTLTGVVYLLLFVLVTRLPVYAVEAIFSATFGARRFLPLSPRWDLVTVGWSAAAVGTTMMALWSRRNVRCPRCRGATEEHQLPPTSAWHVRIGFDDTPHQSCRVCRHRSPLRSPRSPRLWWLAAAACGCVLPAVVAQRTHAVARFVRWLDG